MSKTTHVEKGKIYYDIQLRRFVIATDSGKRSGEYTDKVAVLLTSTEDVVSISKKLNISNVLMNIFDLYVSNSSTTTALDLKSNVIGNWRDFDNAGYYMLTVKMFLDLTNTVKSDDTTSDLLDLQAIYDKIQKVRNLLSKDLPLIAEELEFKQLEKYLNNVLKHNIQGAIIALEILDLQAIYDTIHKVRNLISKDLPLISEELEFKELEKYLNIKLKHDIRRAITALQY